jgi:hypothetical protein
MRTQYYALNERPICGKCRPEFAKRIKRGTGPGSFQRAFLHGLVTALIGAVILGMGVLFIPHPNAVVRREARAVVCLPASARVQQTTCGVR